MQQPAGRVIGVVGGIASGKSAVAGLLESWGAVRIDADKLGHQVLREPDVVTRLVARWGVEILDAEGHANRRAIAARVFAPDGAAELQFLEQVTHPRIGAKIERQLAELPPDAWCVLDAALLLEGGWDRYCRHVVFVDAPWSDRCKRAAQRGWDADELARRESRQIPIAEKKQRADCVIRNDSGLPQLQQQVADFWNAARRTE